MAVARSLLSWEPTVCNDPGMMVHGGLPTAWAWLVALAMLLLAFRAWQTPQEAGGRRSSSIAAWPALGPLVREVLRTPWLLLALKLIVAGLFLLVIVAGLFGTPIPERNLATTLTWGSNLANWILKRPAN